MNNFHAHSLSKPKIIGYYSVDDEGNYLSDSSKMSYYNPPQLGPVRMDLNKGIESVVRTWKESELNLNYFLKWIESNEATILASNTGETIGSEFVCSSGLLTIVMDTPYNFLKSQWQICASKWKGKIYLRLFACYEALNNYNEEMAKKLTFQNHKFKQYILSDHPDTAPDASRPVMDSAEFRCVFKHRFGTHGVILSAKMDGVRSETALSDPLPLDELKFVILKSKRVYQNAGSGKNLWLTDYDLMRWWTQCYVTGTEDILFGSRNNNGIMVRELREYKLEKIVQLRKLDWNPQTCVEYCEKFLDLVARTVVEECDTMVYRFEKVPECGRRNFSNNDMNIKIHEHPTSGDVFMPPSFLTKMK